MASKSVVPPVEIKVETKKSTSTSSVPPLFSFQVANPVTYFQTWWKKLIGNDGLKVTIQVKPITAFVLTMIVCGAGFGAGRYLLPPQVIEYLPQPSPIAAVSATPSPWKEVALTGKLQMVSEKYYLVTSSTEAIKVQVNPSVNLKPLVGKRLLVTGMYDKDEKILIVADVSHLEILSPTPIPIPTLKPSPLPKASPSPTPEPSVVPSM